MRLLLLLLFSSFLLAGCAGSLLPPPAPAPQQWLLKRLPSPTETAPKLAASQFKPSPANKGAFLAVERPTAPTPLRGREIWYRSNEHQLSPFGEQVWAESLDQQIQQRISDFLGQQPWLATSLPDQPGYRSAYRLRITLQEWYLNTATKQLDIAVQINLIDTAGRSLLQQHWVAKPAVTELTAAGMLQTSQAWLEEWAVEVAVLLREKLDQ